MKTARKANPTRLSPISPCEAVADLLNINPGPKPPKKQPKVKKTQNETVTAAARTWEHGMGTIRQCGRDALERPKGRIR